MGPFAVNEIFAGCLTRVRRRTSGDAAGGARHVGLPPWHSAWNSANEPRGARHRAREIAPRPCIRLVPGGVRTMKQSFASAARLGGGGPILTTASQPCSYSGCRHLGWSSAARHASMAGAETRMFLVVPGRGAGQAGCRSTTPCGTSPAVTMRQSAMSSLRARAMIIVVLRAPLAPSVRLRNHCASALSF